MLSSRAEGRKSPQAKFEDATSLFAQMETAFVGVDHSWPGWNALRSLLHYLVTPKRLSASGLLKRPRLVRATVYCFGSILVRISWTSSDSYDPAATVHKRR